MNELIITPEISAYGGLALGRLDGKAVFVKGAIPGETVQARIDEEKKDYCTATVTKVVEPSPDRVEPPCKYFGNCGGCQVQFANYPRQVRMKEEVLAASLRRIARLEIPLSGSLTGSEWNYRRRAQFKVDKGRVGFYRERSHEVIDIDACPLMADEINSALADARPVISHAPISEFHISQGEVTLALLKAPRGTKADWKRLAQALIGTGFSGVTVEAEGRKPLSFGSSHITLDLSGLIYTVSPPSFFQADWGLNRKVVSVMVDALRPLSGKTVLDLYSGAGNFSLPLAKEALAVTGVEGNPHAVEDGRRNAQLNGITNCKFICSDVDALDRADRPDILVTDPPRTGLSGRAVEKITVLNPERVTYLSCNPSTLARDLGRLSARYAVESVRMIDFFPQTSHIEALAFLRRK